MFREAQRLGYARLRHLGAEIEAMAREWSWIMPRRGGRRCGRGAAVHVEGVGSVGARVAALPAAPDSRSNGDSG